jgi:phosphate transport system protein
MREGHVTSETLVIDIAVAELDPRGVTMFEHTVRAFDADLQELAQKIAAMGLLAKRQMADAIDALANCNITLAKSVVTVDDQIDALQREIEEKAVVTIARSQPMAVDLREIIGDLRISNDLERIGDLAENIAIEAATLGDEVRPNAIMLQLGRMTKLVVDQLSRVLDSYARRDAAEAVAAWRRDVEVNAMNSSLFRELLTYMLENPRNIASCLHVSFCAKNLERMGDHAANIAERMYFIVEGRALPDERLKASADPGYLPPSG